MRSRSSGPAGVAFGELDAGRQITHEFTKAVSLRVEPATTTPTPVSRKTIDKHGVVRSLVSHPICRVRSCSQGIRTTILRFGRAMCAVIDDALAVLVSALDPDAVPVFDTLELWKAFDRSSDAAAREDLVGAAGRGRVFVADCGVPVGGGADGEARREVRRRYAKSMLDTSEQVAKLPATAQALRSGELRDQRRGRSRPRLWWSRRRKRSCWTWRRRRRWRRSANECLKARAGKDREKAHKRIRRNGPRRSITDAEGALELRARDSRGWGGVPVGARPDRR